MVLLFSLRGRGRVVFRRRSGGEVRVIEEGCKGGRVNKKHLTRSGVSKVKRERDTGN